MDNDGGEGRGGKRCLLARLETLTAFLCLHRHATRTLSASRTRASGNPRPWSPERTGRRPPTSASLMFNKHSCARTIRSTQKRILRVEHVAVLSGHERHAFVVHGHVCGEKGEKRSDFRSNNASHSISARLPKFSPQLELLCSCSVCAWERRMGCMRGHDARPLLLKPGDLARRR